MFLSASLLVGTGVRKVRQQSIPLPASEDEKTSLAIPSFAAAEVPDGAESRNDAEFLRIDINHCSAEELERLPGIGPVAAGRIVIFREKNGFFRTVEELDRVQGIGKKTLEKIKPYIVINR
jgi:competence protein ComEA